MRAHLLLVIGPILVTSCGPSSSSRVAEPAPSVVRVSPAHATHELPAKSLGSLADGALLFSDLGTHQRTVTTTRRAAQTYFDQGLRLLYGFNHDEAARSFAKGASLDPQCGMCWWGVAYALGPNYNVPMLPDRFAAAWEALANAKAVAANMSPVEQALIGALATRYRGSEPHDPATQQPLNETYAAAMRDVAIQFPGDLDVQVLAAEALMDVRPWKLWTKDGQAEPGTDEIVVLLEGVLAANPQHPGANHYYIHAVEASPNPGRAVSAAERLPALMPGAGHVVHMPAHIYQRVGRYEDASEANRAAVVADLAYLRKTTAPGYYPMYLGHNYGFLAYSSAMEGRSADALAAARDAAKAMPPEMLAMMPGMDFFVSEPLLVMVRFGKWNDILAERRPDPRYRAMTGLWLHAQGMALASTGRLDEARLALSELRALASSVSPDEQASNNPTRAVLAVGAKALEARIAEKQYSPDAPALWTEAVAMEDALAYAEPADWFYPLRHFQGAALLNMNRPLEAEAVYRTDLTIHPNNGWALTGLVKSLEAQRRTQEAKEVRVLLDQAWARADVTPVTTAF
ncbi:MAG: hypothetical protein H0T79_07080 [Deltaproteobacteria bacterium]|nr:hypothetical protein [Deltaproteobacteria bacterium]